MCNKLTFMSMNLWRGIYRLAFAITILYAIVVFADNTPNKDEVTFHFNPPDRTSFLETMRHIKSLTGLELPEPMAELKEVKTNYLIVKTDFGYSVTAKPLQPSMKMSEDISSMLKDVLSDVVLTHDLDKQGKLIRVRGIKRAMEKLEKLLPAELKDLALSFLGKTCEQLAADAWNSRGMGVQANLVGRTYVLNKEYPPVSARVPMPLGGSMLASLRFKISGPTDYKGHRCVKVQYSYESADPNVGEMLGEAMRNLIVGIVKMVKTPEADKVANLIPHFQISNPRLLVKLELFVDAKTGLIYAETEIKTMEALFEVPEEEKSKFRYKETKEYSFDYNK